MADEMTIHEKIAADLPEIQRTTMAPLAAHAMHIAQARIIVQMADALTSAAGWAGGALVEIQQQPAVTGGKVVEMPTGAKSKQAVT